MTKLIILHGLGQTEEDWEDVTNSLDIESLTIPLFSSTDDDAIITIPSIYSSISKQLNVIDEPFYLFGLSLGGLLTLMYTIENKNLLLKGIIVSGAIYKPIPKTIILLQSIVFKLLPRHHFTDIGLTKSQMIQLITSVSVDLTNQLKNVVLPTLVICGEKDKANLTASRQIHNLIVESKLVIIPNGKHELNKSSSDKLSQTINSYIQKKESN